MKIFKVDYKIFKNKRIGLEQADGGACLAVHEAAESRLSFDDAVRDAHLAAQRRQVNYELKLEIHVKITKLILKQTSIGSTS